MAMRMPTKAFDDIALEELAAWLADPDYAVCRDWAVTSTADPSPHPLAHVEYKLGAERAPGTIVLHKKPILALVDAEGAAREIVRNLIRWGLEQ